MKKGNGVQLCRKCGKPIGIISERVYRKIVVDADGVEVQPDPLGEEFIRIDGSKVRARVLDRYDDGTVEAEYVFRPHRCGGAK